MKTQASYTKIQKNGYTLYSNQGGVEIGVAGAKAIEKDGFAFRDLTGAGRLLPYEDWRLTSEQRAKDLANRLTPAESTPCIPAVILRSICGPSWKAPFICRERPGAARHFRRVAFPAVYKSQHTGGGGCGNRLDRLPPGTAVAMNLT